MVWESLVGSESFEDLCQCCLRAAHDVHKGIDLGGNWILSWLRGGNRILSGVVGSRFGLQAVEGVSRAD